MSSINTNLSAMTALQALKATQSALNKTQSQISTGLRVGSAADNASYWSIATKMKSDNGALGAVKDSIGQSVSMINTYEKGLGSTLKYLNNLKNSLVSAQQPGARLDKINSDVQTQIEGMKTAGSTAEINGQNWLTNGGNVDLVTSFNGTSGKVGTTTIDTSQMKLFGYDAGTNTFTFTGGILEDVVAIKLDSKPVNYNGWGAYGDFVDEDPTDVDDAAVTAIAAAADASVDAPSATDKKITVGSDGTVTVEEVVDSADPVNGGNLKRTVYTKNATDDWSVKSQIAKVETAGTATASIQTMLVAVNEAIDKVTNASSLLGANKSLLEAQSEFISSLSDSLTEGVSAFIDADMNEVSTRNQALQTQQQLGVQALSMANQNSQMILKLFQ